MQITAGRLRSGIRLPGRFNLLLNPAQNAKLTIMKTGYYATACLLFVSPLTVCRLTFYFVDQNLNSGFILVGFRCRLCSVQLVESLLFVRCVLRFWHRKQKVIFTIFTIVLQWVFPPY
ncbi:Uncharacterised protein [Klebsiella pneumoniae]|nr:Uncharacterised protein [Klebsiella pneumoniae]